MKNMKVSSKLMVGFLIMTFLIIVTAANGMYALFRMGGISEDMYKNKAYPLSGLATAMEYFQRLGVQTRNAIIYTGNTEQLKAVETEMNRCKEQFTAAMQAYKPTLSSDEERNLFDEIDRQFSTVFESDILGVLEDAKRGMSSTELLDSMNGTTAAANVISNDLSNLIQIRMDIMDAANQNSRGVEKLIFTVDMTFVAVAVCVAVFLARYIAKIISKPIKHLYNFMERAGSTGDIEMSQEDELVIATYSQYNDEIGQCISSVAKFLDHVASISGKLQSVSTGDLSINVDPISEHDVMGNSVKKMVGDLNNIFAEIQNSTVQVATGSKQVADGAQILAQGSAEQASSVEQLSAFVAEITSKIKDSAEMTASAATLANTIKHNAEKGNAQMDHMMEAVKEINQASQSISKVMKVIDDIAFQTNILALNAAVEAARAGQHGKGFAVVAEEVRNLAAKSAEAAKDTGGLISNSMEKAELGARIADETSSSLRDIVSGINESSQIINEISKSSEEQVVGISQLNQGIDQVSAVTQRNNATAEESSAASEEMSSQANVLEKLISQFKLAEGNSRGTNQWASFEQNDNRLALSEKNTF